MAVERKYITYNQVHKLCQASAERILAEFKPNLMIAYVFPFKAGCLFVDSPQYWRRRIRTCPNSSVSFSQLLHIIYADSLVKIVFEDPWIFQHPDSSYRAFVV